MSFRIVGGPNQPQNRASCDAGETMIGAWCAGQWQSYPLTTFQNGAQCGDDATKAHVSVVCAK